MTKNSFIPFFIIALGFVSCRNPEPADFLIHKGYSGRAAVVFEQKNGEKTEYLDGRRLYKIPNDGILLTQFKAEDGFVDYRYFLVDDSGNKTVLPIYEYDYNKDGTVKYLVQDKEKIGIFGHGTTIAFTEPGNDPDHLVFNQPGLEFFVSTFNGLDTVEAMEHFNQRVDSLIKIRSSR